MDPQTGEIVYLLVKGRNTAGSSNTGNISRNAVPIDTIMHHEIANMTRIPPEYSDQYKSIPKTPIIYTYPLYYKQFNQR